MGSLPAMIEIDALVIGGGFGGVWELKHLKDQGFNAKLVESGSNYGGVWYWNRYPGARVDSPIPHYEFSSPEIWKDWLWTQRFPGSAELRNYFSFVADKWDLRKDTYFNSYVKTATWKEDEKKWIVETKDGKVFRATYFLPNIGFAAKRHTPDWKGIDTFKGTWIHPSFWPKEEPDLKGKRIAVIGTGSTGVQLVTDLAPIASKMVLFQRTPNLALPMGQVQYHGDGKQFLEKERYAQFFSKRPGSFGGYDYNFEPTKTFEHSKEERHRFYQSLFDEGDFHFWMANYSDMMFNDEANTEAYNFWREKVRARLNDQRLKEKFAPTIKPGAFGCKRVSLENKFYELFNQEHVHLVDVNETPVQEITPKGIKTSEQEWEFDYVVCATGFDAITGGFLDIDVTGKDGIKLKEFWKDGVITYFGMAVPNFPNMLFTYGPQAPTPFCNGPSCAELQGNWIVDCLSYLRENKVTTIEANMEDAGKWAKHTADTVNKSLLPATKSWYMGDNIPGKRREPLIYLGGVPTYYKKLNDSAAAGYAGFDLA